MKHKKLLAFTLVTVLLCTSLTVMAGGSATEEATKEFAIKKAFRGRLFDFVSRIFNAFPFLEAFFSMPQSSGPEKKVPEQPYKPKMSFDIELEKVYKLDQEIKVKAVLTNEEKVPMIVDCMSFEFGTLNIVVVTPTGRQLRYVGDIAGVPKKETIGPGQSTDITIEDITVEDLLWKIDNTAEVYPGILDPFRVLDRPYSIFGIYDGDVSVTSDSGISPVPIEVHLQSETYEFTIIGE